MSVPYMFSIAGVSAVAATQQMRITFSETQNRMASPGVCDPRSQKNLAASSWSIALTRKAYMKNPMHIIPWKQRTAQNISEHLLWPCLGQWNLPRGLSCLMPERNTCACAAGCTGTPMPLQSVPIRWSLGGKADCALWTGAVQVIQACLHPSATKSFKVRPQPSNQLFSIGIWAKAKIKQWTMRRSVRTGSCSGHQACCHKENAATPKPKRTQAAHQVLCQKLLAQIQTKSPWMHLWNSTY